MFQKLRMTLGFLKRILKVKRQWRGWLQDGRAVRHGNHLPPHKYIKTTSTCGTTPTEHLLNVGRRPQTSQKQPQEQWIKSPQST